MKHKWAAPTFVVAASILRASAFFRSVVDWDESLYMLMARSLLEGNAPYTAIWNNTPPGIYAIFASVLLLFPNSIQAVRAFTAIVVGLTAFLLYRLGTALSKGDQALGLAAGALYLLYSGSTAMGALASNTELFYALFTVWGFLTLLAGESRWAGLCAGLLFGAGFQIKYHVAFDFLAALIVVAGRALSAAGPRAVLRQWALMILGFLLPSLGVAIAFLVAGHFQEYAHAALAANLIYVADGTHDVRHALGTLADQAFAHPLLWLSVAFIGLKLALTRRNIAGHRGKLFALIWFGAGFLGILATRRFWNHYFLQTLPAMCLLTAYAVLEILRLDTTKWQRAFVVAAILFSTGMLNPVRASLNTALQSVYQRYVLKSSEWKDTPLQIAEYLNERTTGSDLVYIADYQPVIYFLAHARPPTRYLFPDHLTNPDLAGITGIDPVAELHAIMGKSPRYVVRRREPEHAPSPFYLTLDAFLADRYVHETSFRDRDGVEVDLYRLRE